jgi:GxxExxY protein
MNIITKASVALGAAHTKQLLNYLQATRIDHGLLINFGAESLEFGTQERGYLKVENDPTVDADLQA